MKTVNVVKAAVGEGVSDDAQEMMIDEASSVFLMDALGKLYSQPARAALREYLANGIDAHIEAGGNRPPIKVMLPDINKDRMLSIRDYGNGMSEEQFGSILRRYGASTKRHSNNLTGGFGLGAKAGFAIADEFFMTSYQNGLALRVHIFKNAEGKGFIEVVERNRTTEPDGMLVEVVVPASNVSEVSIDSLETDKFFEAYKPSDVVVEGPYKKYSRYGADEIIERRLDLEESSLHEPTKFDTLEYGGNIVGWVSKSLRGYSGRNSPIRAIIGRVSYEVKWDASRNEGYSSKYAYSSKFGEHMKALNNLEREIVLNLPIGSVDLPSSREEITYSERSLRTITAVAESVYRVIEEHFQRDVNSYETGYEALREIIKLYSDGFWKAPDMTWRSHVPPLVKKGGTLAPGNASFAKDVKDIIIFTKSPDGRPSLTSASLWETQAAALAYWGQRDNREFFMVAKDDEEYLLAAKKIRTTLTDYRKAVISDYAPTASVILVKATDPNLFWFEHGTKITLDEFLATTKKYRAEIRATTKAVHPNATVAKKTATRQASWISLSKEKTSYFPLTVNTGDESELLEGKSNFYYLSKNEVSNVSALLTDLAPQRRAHASAAQIHDGHKNLVLSLRQVLGEDANIVFIPANRKMEDFHASFPNVPSLASELTKLFKKEWEDVKDNGKKDTYLQSLFWSIPNSHRVVNVHRFVESLTAGEKVGLNADLLELVEYMPYERRTASNAISTLFNDLLGVKAKADVVSWMNQKATTVITRYPLLTQMSLYGTEWSGIKTEMLRYLKTC